MAIKKNKRDEKAKEQIKRLMDEHGVEFYSKKDRSKLTRIVLGKSRGG